MPAQATACADRLCSGTDYLDKTLWMEGRLHVFTPVRMALVLDGPGLPWGLFLRRRHPVDGIGEIEHRAALIAAAERKQHDRRRAGAQKITPSSLTCLGLMPQP